MRGSRRQRRHDPVNEVIPSAARKPGFASAEGSRPPLVAFQDVSLRFGEAEILRDINLVINHGEFVCVGLVTGWNSSSSSLKFWNDLAVRQKLIGSPLDLKAFVIPYSGE